MKHNIFNSLQTLSLADGGSAEYYSLPQLEKEGVGKEIPFLVARILLQDFTGVPLLVDLAAMRSAVNRLGKPADLIEPLVPVDLIIDHSVQVDVSGRPDALDINMKMEFERNQARYQFLKWGMQGFNGFNVIPPGTGICHQVNLEYLAKVVQEKDGILFPDTLVGTDSHTVMINGLGVLGWGVGGIEAEAGMLGQPVYFLTPDVVGVRISGKLAEGVTATDLVLRVTEMLREAKVVGKFVEYFGPGVADLTVPDRATIGNMGPEYGATCGIFPVDEMTCSYLMGTGRSQEQAGKVRDYYTAQRMFGLQDENLVEYSKVIDLNLEDIEPCVAGPKRPQDRILLGNLKNDFMGLLKKDPGEGGFGQDGAEIGREFPVIVGMQGWTPLSGGGSQNDGLGTSSETSTETETEMVNNRPTPNANVPAEGDFAGRAVNLSHGSVVIASITSCTNTSNPSVMIAAGLLAKRAVEAGIEPPAYVKTSLAPGSRVVTEYLEKTGLQKYLDRIGFNLVGYGCATCIGNSGPLDPNIEDSIFENNLVLASVLSGNRNFEARVHQSVKANFLMSPPLVVAFALAGRVDIDLTEEPLGRNREGKDIYLRDIWPGMDEIRNCMATSFDAETYKTQYAGFAERNPLWNEIPFTAGDSYKWDDTSTYIQEPPYFENFSTEPGKIESISGARPLAIFGRSVTTDHISPAGSIKPDSPAGLYLQERGVAVEDFNSYGSRRGNHQVMIRGTFANVRIRNLMAPGTEGGVTVHHPSGERMSIYDAACRYQESGTPLIVLAGQEYGTGSSRDWAAKGTMLLGVRAVVAQSFERIHRSNLVGMGVLPCQFEEGTNAESLKLDGSETFDLNGLEDSLKPNQKLSLIIHRNDGGTDSVPLTLRLDTPVEVSYYRHGGILQYVLSQILSEAGSM
ncbi:MAG: aconitate hydratase [Acidobacteriota bacterium]